MTICTSAPTQTYAEPVSKRCVLTCPDSYFGDKYTTAGKGVCSTSCPTGYFGDPTTHLCVAICPSGYYGNPLGNRTCVQKCP